MIKQITILMFYPYQTDIGEDAGDIAPGTPTRGVWLYPVAHHALHRHCPLFREATSSGWNLGKAGKELVFIIWEQ